MFRKILVPLDSSVLAERALPYAQTLALRFEAELTLLHVLPPAPILAEYDNNDDDDCCLYYIKAQEAKIKTYLHLIQDGLAQRHLRTRAELLTGNPVAEMILDLAHKRDIDLIVMSTHGHSGSDRWLYGSVASKILEGAPCPVFLVRVKDQNH